MNPTCEGKFSEYISAPDFCLSYYRVKRSKSFKEEICSGCYNKSIKDLDKLATTLKNGELILGVDYPIINETLQIEDSDEEDDEDNEDMEYIDDENFEFISKNIDIVIANTLEKFKIEKQYQLETDYLKTESKRIAGNYKALNSWVYTITHLVRCLNSIKKIFFY